MTVEESARESETFSQLGMEDTQPNLHMECQGTGATMLNGLPEQLSADSVPTSVESHVAGCGDTSITSELSSRATTQDSSSPSHPSQRRRRRWTKQDNERVMRCYYYATHSSFPSIGYRIRMLTRWESDSPPFQATEQRLADQARNIRKKGYLSAVELDALKAIVEEEMVRPETSEPSDVVRGPDVLTSTSNDQHDEELGDNMAGGAPPQTAPPISIPPERDRRADPDLQLRLMELFLDIKERPMSERQRLPKPYVSRKRLTQVTKEVDVAAHALLPEANDPFLLNCLQYAAATLITETVGTNIRSTPRRPPRNKPPRWEGRLRKKISEIRAKVSRLNAYIGNEDVNNIRRHFNVPNIPRARDNLQLLKQKLSAYSQRLKRYKASADRKKQNLQFWRNPKLFLRHLKAKRDDNAPSQSQRPTKEALEEFWSGLLSNSATHEGSAQWLHRQREELESLPEQPEVNISMSDMKTQLQRVPNWKAPGPDQLQGFWIKKLTSLHDALLDSLNYIFLYPEDAPPWLAKGITYLIPKEGDPKDPKNYRPITCLPTTYKLLTSIIAEKIRSHILDIDIMAEEQKGCCRGSLGCKEQLLIDLAILDEVHRKKRNLSVAWIDLRKAFDSVPHSWLLEVLRLYKVNPTITSTVAELMKTWSTSMSLGFGENAIHTEEFPIRRGIYQGDSLSPLLFCLAINPISKELNSRGSGYKLGSSDVRLNHLFYMDDLKLFAPNDSTLDSMIQTTNQIASDIGMSFGLNKCAKLSIRRGKISQVPPTTLWDGSVIEMLLDGKYYCYLGTEEDNRPASEYIKKRLIREYRRRLKQALKTKLNAGNLVRLINMYAVSVFSYSFGVIPWSRQELLAADRVTRKMMTIYRCHHPKASVERLYLSRQSGGRGLIQIASLHDRLICGIEKKIQSRSTPLLLEARKIMSQRRMGRKADVILRELDLSGPEIPNKHVIRAAQQDLLSDQLKQKALHGRYWKVIDRAYVDVALSHRWLKSSTLKPETEGFLLATQDQVLKTRNYEKVIIRCRPDDSCRVCGNDHETISHLISGCEQLAGTAYVERHDRVVKYIHWCLCKDLHVPELATSWFNHKLEGFIEKDATQIYWERPIVTDRPITANKPDIVIVDRQSKLTLLVDISIPGDWNVATKEAEKHQKYSELKTEIRRMWNTEVKTVPVIVGALGTVKKTLPSCLELLSPNARLEIVQREAILGTLRLLRRVLDIH